MIEIDDKIVSADLLRECFACDLAACKGICCVEGNAGALLEIDEVDTLEREYPNYRPCMTAEGIEAVERQGFMVVDEDGDLTTPLVNGAECAYAYRENGVTLCAIEKAWMEGKTSFRKPISCHLYPIRVMRFSNGTVGLNYHRWSVCAPARQCGARLGIRATRRCARRSSAASARSFIKRSEPPKRWSNSKQKPETDKTPDNRQKDEKIHADTRYARCGPCGRNSGGPGGPAIASTACS